MFIEPLFYNPIAMYNDSAGGFASLGTEGGVCLPFFVYDVNVLSFMLDRNPRS